MENKKIFIIDTIISYRVKYAIEARSLEDAYDEVVMIDSGNPANRFEEMSQKFLGENIVQGMETTEAGFHELLTKLSNDPDELSSHWMGDSLIRRIKYND